LRSESASSACQQQSRLERRRLPPCPFSVPLPMFSNASMARPEARKQCTCEALICMSCHKQVQRWKCAAIVRGSLHTLPNIPSRPCRIAVDRPYPASPATEEASLDSAVIHVITRLSQGCVQTRASALPMRRHHTTVKVLCASGGCPGYLGELPLVRSTSIIVLVVKETVVVDRQGMVAGICPVGSTGTKLCGHTVSTA
jgi:hypothetical protein